MGGVGSEVKGQNQDTEGFSFFQQLASSLTLAPLPSNPIHLSLLGKTQAGDAALVLEGHLLMGCAARDVLVLTCTSL